MVFSNKARSETGVLGGTGDILEKKKKRDLLHFLMLLNEVKVLRLYHKSSVTLGKTYASEVFM